MHPTVIANAAASINELTGGRGFIGIGAGNPLYKFRRSATLRQLRQAVEFMRQYMTGEEAEYEGVKTRSQWIGEPLPIYMTAHGRSPCSWPARSRWRHLTVRAPAYVEWQLEQVAKGAERAGRDPESIDTWARTMIYVTDDKRAARRELSAFPATYRDLHKL